jgi:uncharacterized protein YyaL (SSP411 family)
MADGTGRLLHSFRDGRARHPATLDDYADLCRAALALHEATGEAPYLEQALAWIAVLDRHYWDGAGGGYFLTADDTPGLIARSKTANDAAVPAGNGTVAGVFARLYFLTGDAAHRERAEAILRAFSGELERNIFPLATLINSAELLERGLQIVIRGRRGAADTAALLRAVHGASLPNRVLSVVPPEQALPGDHLAAGKGMIGDRATVYLCEGPVCSLPITDPDALGRTLAERR